MGRYPIASANEEALLQALESRITGLNDAEARARAGSASVSSPSHSPLWQELRLFLRQFRNPLILLLLAAVLLAAFLGERSDMLIILSILSITSLVGFLQERSAIHAAARLRRLTGVRHTVRRNGVESELPPDQIVPGDILVFNAGDIIPSDCRILESNELHVDESSLTGESFPVLKSTGSIAEDVPLSLKTNCLWNGTHVISGTATALAVDTGSDTRMGQLAQRLEEPQETTFETGVRRFGYFILRTTLVLAVGILFSNLFFGKGLFDAILFALALAVGMAPELLPAIMTFAMASGARRLVKRKVLVKKLSSISNLGEIGILCTDKTGTITEGTIRVAGISDPHGNSSPELLLLASLNARLQQGFDNPIDKALSSIPIDPSGWQRLAEIPYDFQRKRLSVLARSPAASLLITKGAFPEVLSACSTRMEHGRERELNEEDRSNLARKFQDYATEGYRVLGLATRVLPGQSSVSRADEAGMCFRGFILLEDPLKATALHSIDLLRRMHVQVKVITGDNRHAAAHAARLIGMHEQPILTGAELETLSPEALKHQARQVAVFAEIEPHQKERIVMALKETGKGVAYMGDGINDVAAMHAADCAISTDNAADVTREASDFVLLEKDLAVVADGIHEGRRSFANTIKYIYITTGATFGNMISVAVASVFLPFLPLLPKQILLINFLSDLPFMAIAADHVDQAQMERPGKWRLPVIQKFMVVFGIHSSAFDMLTFFTLYQVFGLRNAEFRTGWFIESVLTELLILFVVRTRKPFFRSRPGKTLLWGAIGAMCATILLPWSPFASALELEIPEPQVMVAIGSILLAYLLTADALKHWFFRHLARKNP